MNSRAFPEMHARRRVGGLSMRPTVLLPSCFVVLLFASSCAGPPASTSAGRASLITAAGTSASAATGASTTASAPIPRPSVPPEPSAAVASVAGTIVFARAGGGYGDETIFVARDDIATAKQVTSPGVNCCPRISPDGKTVAYAAPADGDRITTALLDIATGRERVLALPDATFNLGAGGFTRDGKGLALFGWDNSDVSRNGTYISDLNGKHLRRVTAYGPADVFLDFSPDGEQLVFVEEGTAKSTGELFIATLRTGKVRRLTPEGMLVGMQARFSPDGKTILFSDSRVSTTGILWVVHPDGTGLRKVFEDRDGRFASSATWSPDGRQILFALNPVADDFSHPANAFYIINAAGTDLRLVLDDGNFKREPEWRP